jgi:hypothetical protein
LKQDEEIDLIASGEESSNSLSALFGECKWRSAPTGIDTLNDLVRKSELLTQFTSKRYILFSKSGFTAGLKNAARTRSDLILTGLNQMF